MSLNGPDQILDAEDITTVHANGRVRLQIGTGDGLDAAPPVSVPGLLTRVAGKYPDCPALAYKTDGVWQKISYKEYLEQVRTCAKAFLKLGLERHHAVCILGFNSPEWFLSDIGAIFAGGIAVGIYTTNTSDSCFHCADVTRANIIVVQDQKQLEKILSIKSQLTDLKAIIQYEGCPSEPDVLSWHDFMTIGRDQPDEDLDEVLKTIGINECCTIVFTSGTVGKPKAVMLSHDNLTWDAASICGRVEIKPASERLVSYLPLSHVAAQTVDIYLTMTNAACVYFADKDALKGSLVGTLQEALPTKFLAVPRVWEKMNEKMTQVGAESGFFKKTIASWAKNQALDYHLNKMMGNTNKSWGYVVASAVIFKKIKQALGLSECTVFASAAAPCSSDIKRYFLSIDIPIYEAFGMSEVSGAHTLNCDANFDLDSIGPPIPGVKSKIVIMEDDQGELCVSGRHVFMGYLNDREKTDEAIATDGWLHTGDIATISEKNNNVFMTGRLKELIITSGGENVAPVLIEQIIKAELPHISNAFLIGDKRKFLSVLLSLKTEVDLDNGRPLDTLLPSVKAWLKDLGCPASTVSEVLAQGPDIKLLDALNAGIARANKHAISNAQKIQKLTILPADFSVITGELGPTMKVKRNKVLIKYEELIEKMYASK